jgi:hypothetical protein
VKQAEILNVPNVSGKNEKTWMVPAGLPSGKYVFRVASLNGLVKDETENYLDNIGIVLVSSPSGMVSRGSSATVAWHGFGLGCSTSVSIDLYRNGTRVSKIGSSDMSHSSGCGRSWYWVAGTLGDPEAAEPTGEADSGGGYTIRVYDISKHYHDESDTFTIVDMINPGKLIGTLRGVSRIPVFPGPGCPGCGEVQLSDLLEVLRTTPEAHVVELWHGGRSLGKLVEAGAAGRRLASRRIDFGNSFQQLKQGGSGFELRIFDNKGKLLHTQAVELNYKAK